MIIGITGSFGSGKGTVVEYLVTKGYKHFSAREFLTEEIRKRNLPIDRDSMILVANDLRAQNGPTHVIKALFIQAQAYNGNAVVESVRAVAEVRYIKEHGGVVLGVDADQRIRYERTTKRASETDHVTLEQWLDQERRETNPQDPAKQNIFGALDESDHIIHNNGSLAELHEQIEAVLVKIQKSVE
jgi:dephospho-CoA kinase